MVHRRWPRRGPMVSQEEYLSLRLEIASTPVRESQPDSIPSQDASALMRGLAQPMACGEGASVVPMSTGPRRRALLGGAFGFMGRLERSDPAPEANRRRLRPNSPN